MPGIRISVPGTSPAKIAVVVVATMALMAIIGSMKYVNGTSRATAMVAVRPGMAPMNVP